MKRLIFAFCIVTAISACKKTEIKKPEFSSVTVVNAMVNAGAVKVNYFGESINWLAYAAGTSTVNYGGSQVYGFKPGNNIHIVQSLDTTKTLFNAKVTENDQDYYSLFLTGTLAAPEVIVKKEALARYYDQEVIAVRVINLSPNSAPVNVTLSSSSTVNEFTGVAYKQITEFKKLSYPATLVTGSNIFQVRDAAGNLLASYTLPATGTLSVATARYKNITLVVRGLQGTTTGTNAFAVSAIPNF